MRRATSALLSAAVVIPLLAACGTDGGGDPTSAATDGNPATQEPTWGASITKAPITDAPTDDPTGGGLSFAKNSGEWDLVFTDVRVAEREGFDRVVLEFTGTGIPGWSVKYVDEAVLDGSGRKVPLGGDATLDIYASGTTWPAPGYYSGPRRLEPEHGGDVSEVYVAGTFEGYTQVLAGIDGDTVPFRVFALADPPRLVVDVDDDNAD